MTSRLLLTLLAILTGLSVQGSAMHARVLPAGSTQVAAFEALATVREAKASAILARPVARPNGAEQRDSDQPAVDSNRISLRPVLTGIDRARE